MGVERHDLGLLCALLPDVSVEQIAQALRDLIAELNPHADVRNAAKQSFERGLVPVAVVVGGEVTLDASEFVAGHKCPSCAPHDLVAHGQAPEGNDLSDGARFEPS